MSSVRSVKLAALGYYGFSNLGDEAVLAGIRAALLSEPTLAQASLLALSADPDLTRRLHPGVDAAPRWSWRGAWEALKGTDLFLFGGGSLLQDATSVRSVLWYFLMASLARRRARRVLWWGQGVGPLTSPHARRLTRLLAHQADALTVRDAKSARLLKEIGARGSIEVVADPAFALTPEPGAAPTGTILALRHWRGLSVALPDGLPEPLCAVPMHLPDDASVLGKEAATLYNWKESGQSIAQVCGRFAAARLTVAMRLHALIFSARCATPFVALSYDPKVDALAEAAGQQDALVPIEKATEKAVMAAAVERVLASEAQRRERLRAFADARSLDARIPARIAAELLS